MQPAMLPSVLQTWTVSTLQGRRLQAGLELTVEPRQTSPCPSTIRIVLFTAARVELAVPELKASTTLSLAFVSIAHAYQLGPRPVTADAVPLRMSLL